MKYIEFGSEKKKVSVIGVGCMRIADMTVDEIDVFVKSAMESGINFFDHADIYAGGKSEEVFGTVLAAEPSLRDKMFLQSKVGINSGMYDFSRERILTPGRTCSWTRMRSWKPSGSSMIPEKFSTSASAT